MNAGHVGAFAASLWLSVAAFGAVGAGQRSAETAAAFAAPDLDVFGITKLMPSRTPALEWNARHWSQGARRTISDWDPSDTTGWSRKRGDTQLMEVDGHGMLRMGGVQPRLYFMARPGHPLFFRDVEVTGYFRRVGSDGATNGGFMVGLRSGPEGHASQPCLANTYYGGIRYPGTWVFSKELWHPNDSPGRSGRLFPGTQTMPAGRWIGMKYLATNLAGGATVKLELHVDTVSNGSPVNGGAWTKVAEFIDDGNWTAPTGACGYPANTVVTQGGGAVLIRNTGATEAQYKMLSIREIAPGGVALSAPPRGPTFGVAWEPGRVLRLRGASGRFRISDLRGGLQAAAHCSGAGPCRLRLPPSAAGLLVVAREGVDPFRLLVPPASASD